MTYTFVLFDADETLYDFTKSEANALKLAFGDHGLTSEVYAESYQRINKQLWKEYEEGTMTQGLLRTERFRRLFVEHGIQLEAEAFSKRYVGHLGEGDFLLDGAVEICEWLRANGVRMGIITNGISEVQRRRIGKSELSDMFEGIIVSEEAGYQKPQKGIFDYAWQKLELGAKDNVLLIGDSLTSDIQGGNLYGIDTCWFNPGRKPNTSGITPTYEIHDLSEIRKLFST